jgi:peptide chain release factor 1
MDIKPEDLQVEVARRTPPGGQQVGTESGVRITHLPTGLTAECPEIIGRAIMRAVL